MKTPAQEIQVDEVLKPGTNKSSTATSHGAPKEISALLAHLMDKAFVIPGTNIRFGLDPLLGLIPGLGDALGASAAAYILTEAQRTGVPLSVKIRMAGNVLLNAGVGAIPVIGDAFSVWFKSNVRNYHLLEKAQANNPQQRKRTDQSSKLILVSIFLITLSISLAVIYLAYQLLKAIF